MAPAIRLAQRRAIFLNTEQRRLTTSLPQRTSRIFPNRAASSSATATSYKPGDRFTQPELAAHAAPASPPIQTSFYHGPMAAELSRIDPERRRTRHRRRPRALTRSRSARPLTGTYRGCEIISAPPPVVRRHRAPRDSQHPLRLRPRADGRPTRPTTGPSHHRSLPRAPSWTAPTTWAIPTSSHLPIAQLTSPSATPPPGANPSSLAQPSPSATLHAPRRLLCLRRLLLPRGCVRTSRTDTTHYLRRRCRGQRRRSHNHAQRPLRLRA